MIRLHNVNSVSILLLLLLCNLIPHSHPKSLERPFHDESEDKDDKASVREEVELTTVGDVLVGLTEAYSTSIEIDDISAFDDIKESIVSIVKHLRDETVELVESEELLETEKMIEDLDDKTLTEDEIEALKVQILNSYLEIDDEYRSEVQVTFDKLGKLLKTRQKADHHIEELEEIWEHEREEDSDSVTSSENLNIFDKFKSKNIYDKHTHTTEASSLLNSLTLNPFLTPVVIMIVFTLAVCLVLACMVTRKTRRASKLVSQVGGDGVEGDDDDDVAGNGQGPGVHTAGECGGGRRQPTDESAVQKPVQDTINQEF